MSRAVSNNPIHKPLTRKQKAFVEVIKKNPKISMAQAALKTYGKNSRPPTYQSAQQIAFENLRKPNILYELAKYDKKVQQRLIDLTELSDSDNLGEKRLALDAINSTLDRLHGKPTQKTLSGKVETIDDLLAENT